MFCERNVELAEQMAKEGSSSLAGRLSDVFTTRERVTRDSVHASPDVKAPADSSPVRESAFSRFLLSIYQ